MKLYFVRHGQTYLNKYKRMQGWADAPLTSEGELVALETGERLADIPFKAVYTSDLGRTQHTAIDQNRNAQRFVLVFLKEKKIKYFMERWLKSMGSPFEMFF